MKTWCVALLVLTVALAGCGKQDPLAPYMMEPQETPDSCYYLQPEGEMATYFALAGFGENPGSINNDFLAQQNVTPTANRIAIFECKFGEKTAIISSGVIQFGDSRAATEWILDVQEQAGGYLPLACNDQAKVFVDGAFVGGLATDSDLEVVQASMEAAFARILDETGAKEYCPT